MEVVVAGLMILMGVAIAGVWTRDILVGDKVDLGDGIFRACDESGSLLWPHWLAEYTTAILLLGAGVGLLVDTDWAPLLAALALGALFYTSVNSLGWALAVADRRAYVAPMVVGGLVSFVGTIWLLAR